MARAEHYDAFNRAITKMMRDRYSRDTIQRTFENSLEDMFKDFAHQYYGKPKKTPKVVSK